MAEKGTQRFSYGFIFPFFLKKCWIWFADPGDVKNCAMVNFFSYNNVDTPGFHKKKGLTLVIDLTQDINDIWLAIRKKFTRSLISKGEAQGVIVKIDNNFNNFRKIYKDFRTKKHLSADKFSLFKNGLLFSAYYQNKLIAGHVFVADDKYIRSWVAASIRLDDLNGKDKRLVGCANRMLIWEAIKYAKNKGLKLFDMGGIDIDGKNQLLKEFKESFGGQQTDCYYYHKVYSPILKLWINLRK